MQRRRFLQLSVAGVLSGCGSGSSYVSRLPEPLSTENYSLTPFLPSVEGGRLSLTDLNDAGTVVGREETPLSRVRRGRTSPISTQTYQTLVRIAWDGTRTVLLTSEAPLPSDRPGGLGVAAISDSRLILGWNDQNLLLWDANSTPQIVAPLFSSIRNFPVCLAENGSVYFGSVDRLVPGANPEYVPTTLGQTVQRTLYAVAGTDTLAGAAAPLYEELRPWRRHKGVEELLPVPQGATGSGALLAVVDWGDAAGRVGTQPLLYRGSQPILLPLPPGYSQGEARGLNADTTIGVVYGQGSQRAVLWKGTKVTFLDDLLPDGSGWTLTMATAINRMGEILAAGQYDGKPYSVLLRPHIVIVESLPR